MDFIVTTVELRRDLRHFITKTIKSNEKEQLAGILLDDDDDDLVESRDDLVFGIDDISLFDLDDPFVYTQKDKFFFLFTLLILLLHGFFILSTIYFLAGVHMSFLAIDDEEESLEGKE